MTQQQTHILLAEDDHSLRATLAHILTRAGYRITEAPDGEAALALLRQSVADHTPYDIVLTDIVMGVVDGIAVLQAAMKQNPAPMVIMLTGYASVETAISALRAGAYDYIRKPCSNADLLRCVASAVQHQQTRVQQRHAIQTITHMASHLEASLQQAAPPAPLAPPALPPTSNIPEHPSPPSTSTTTSNAPEHPPPPPISTSTSTSTSNPRYYQIGSLCIDTHRHTVSLDGTPIHITPAEYELLSFLASHAGRVLRPSTIVQHTHGHTLSDREARQLLKPHILNVRRKLPADLLVTVRGTGYMLVVPDD